MTPLDKQPLQTFKVFLEDSSGVLECIVGVFDKGRGRFLMPMATRIVSGDFEKVTKARLEDAIRTLKWARRHPEVYLEARVAYDDNLRRSQW
jgi:hypothetical protein